jgi:hypothetical protein
MPPIESQPLVIDWAPLEREGDKVLFIFDGGRLDDDELSRVTFVDNEVSEVCYVHPDDLGSYTPDRLTPRIRAGLTARTQEKPIYAEHGRPA